MEDKILDNTERQIRVLLAEDDEFTQLALVDLLKIFNYDGISLILSFTTLSRIKRGRC